MNEFFIIKLEDKYLEYFNYEQKSAFCTLDVFESPRFESGKDAKDFIIGLIKHIPCDITIQKIEIELLEEPIDL